MIATARPTILFALTTAVLLMPAAALSQQPISESGPGIWVGDATGQLRKVEPSSSFLRDPLRSAVPSGSVRVVLAVESFAESATGALSAGQLAVSRVIAAGSRLGATAVDVDGEAFVVEPRYERPRILAGSWERPRVVGFQSIQLVALQLANSRRLGLLIDTAVGAGATRVLDVLTADDLAAQ